MKAIQRILCFLLCVALLLGAVPAFAAGTFAVGGLKVPDFIELPKDKAKITFSVSEAQSVKVDILDASGAAVATFSLDCTPAKLASVVWDGKAGQGSTAYAEGSYVPGGSYTVKVSSAADSAGAASAAFAVKAPLGAPKAADISVDKTQNKVYASWTPVKDCAGYEIEIFLLDKAVGTVKVDAPDACYADITTVIAQNGYSKYRVKVRALGGANSTPSEAAQSPYRYVFAPDGTIDGSSGYYDSFFNDAGYLGDSIGNGLKNYVTMMRQKNPSFMGSFKLFPVGCYNLTYATNPAPKMEKAIRLNGQKVNPEVALQAVGAKKVFSMIGMNDMYRKPEDYVKLYELMISNIRETCPNIQVFIMNVTPIVTARENETIYNKKINKFNEALKAMCEKDGFVYVSFADRLRDSTGGLDPKFASDGSIHLLNNAYEIIIEELRKVAMQQMTKKS